MDNNSEFKCLFKHFTVKVQTAIKAAEPRFLSKVNKSGPLMPGMLDRCWDWLGQPSNVYGQICIEGKDINIHVYSWLLHGGVPTPRGFNLHHLCNNTRCVNPHHLAMVTTIGHRRFHSIILTATCANGHAFNENNPLIDGNGYRRCRECAAEQRQSYNKKRGRKHAT